MTYQIPRKRECRSCTDCEFSTSIFRILSEEEQEIMNRNRFVVSYNAGELIFKQGSSLTHIISLTSGLAKLYQEGRRSLISRIVKPVELLLGPDLFLEPRHFNSAAALSDVEACFIEMGNFREVFYRNPRFAEEVMKEVNQSSLFTINRLMHLNLKQTPGLVAEALVFLSETVYERTSFEMLLSRQELADFCGITKESAIRTLKDFKDEGIIREDHNIVHILDVNMLKKISELG